MPTSLAILEPPEQTGADRDRAALGRIVRLVIIGAVAFVLTAGVWELVGNSLHARPEIPQPFKTKIDLCLNSPVPYDTLFIGSSRYFHGIDPAVFDAQMKSRGLLTHSYNLGFDALSFQELHFVAHHVLSDPRSRLKYLFIEPSLRVRLAPGLEHSQRQVVLHDARGSVEVFQLILRGNHDWKRKLFWLYEQASVSAVRLANVGALTNKFIHPQEPPTDITDVAGTAGNGYAGLDPDIPLGPATTAQDIADMMSDQKNLEKTGSARKLNGFEIAELTDLQTQAAARGVKLLLLAPPTATADMYGEFSAVMRASQSGQLRVPVFSFADPITYFDLYDPKGFVDPDHIGQPVAQRWSKRAADAFANLLLAGGKR
jgi:hypothetical protein